MMSRKTPDNGQKLPANNRTPDGAGSIQPQPPPPQYMQHPDGDEGLAYDNPIWRREYSYRGQPYRYLFHQRGLVGHLKVRIICARDLCKPLLGASRGRQVDISPQVYVRFTDAQLRSSVAAHNAEPTWRKEELIFEYKKGATRDGAPVYITVEVVDAGVTTISFRKSASLGIGSFDISPLLKGEDGHAVLDAWVELTTGATVNLIMEYEPNGKEPELNDVVYLEGFARQPRSLVLPSNEPYVVKALAGNYLLVSFLLKSSRDNAARLETPGETVKRPMGCVRIHRNTVFVVERRTLTDDVWHRMMRPKDMVLSTRAGKWVKKALKPYVTYAKVLAAPMLVSFQLAFGAARLAMRSALAGVSEATNTALGTTRQHHF